MRSSDTVSRQGGDEFLVLLADVVHPHDAALCARKDHRSRSRRRIRIAGHDLRITASIGIATYPGDAADAETLLRNADFAMYQAKYTGPQQLPVLPAGDERQCDRAPIRRD